MFKILTLNSIAAAGLDQLPGDVYQTAPDVHQPDAILVRSQSLHDMVIPSSVKAVGRAGAGVNNIPVSLLTRRGIPVFNTPGANANAVRELVIAGMLLASRNIIQACKYVDSLPSGKDMHDDIEQNKKRFVGHEILGKTLGVIGLGSVGVRVANAALNLGMQVIGYDPAITVNRAWELSANVRQAGKLDEMLGLCDFVSFHVPLTDATRSMMGPDRLALLKRGAVLLNFAREGITDTAALLHALETRHVSAYVTDFPCATLKTHPNVISLPHLGASTREAEENCAVMIVRQVRNFLEHGVITNAANFPAVDAAPVQTGVRLAIVNANIPNMVAQISSRLASAGLNILSLVNKSMDQIAYTLIDVNSAVPANVLSQIEAVDGVIQIRALAPISHARRDDLAVCS